jgi:hypothetical protein
VSDARADTLQSLAPQLASQALANIDRAFPYAPGHVVRDRADRALPGELHPVFYGSFDWHSAVHMHWLLVRLLRRCPQQIDTALIRRRLDMQLDPDRLRVEADYLRANPWFERPYGWAWLWTLAAECRTAGAAAARWVPALEPAVAAVADLLADWLARAPHAVRDGTHGNDAFSLGLLLDAAPSLGQQHIAQLIKTRAMQWYLDDRDAPARWEPSGHDFLSPALAEADLMRRLLAQEEFTRWWRDFLPAVPESLRVPAGISASGDAQIGHLHGLDFHRAAAFNSIAGALSGAEPADLLRELAARHLRAALPALDDADYSLTHWLPTFAVLALESNQR